MDYQDKDLLAFVMASLKNMPKQSVLSFWNLTQAFLWQRTWFHKKLKSVKETMAIAKDIQALGVEWTGLTEDMAENIQPRFQANIHKEDFTEEQLSKSTKQAVRTAPKQGDFSPIWWHWASWTIRFSDEEDRGP